MTRRDRPGCVGWLGLSPSRWPAVARVGRRADGARSRSTRATSGAERILYVQSAEALQADGARLRRARGRRLLDSRDPALRRRRRLSGRPRALRAALSAARSDDDARSVLHDRLPVRRDLPERAGRRAVPGGPTRRSRCSRKGIAAQPDKWQLLRTTSASSLLAAARLQAAADWFQRAAEQPDAPNWLRPLTASMLTRAAIARRRGSSGSRCCSPIEEWLRRTPSAGWRSSMRWTSSISSRRSSRGSRRRPGAAHSWEGAGAAGLLRDSDSIRRDAVRSRSGDRHVTCPFDARRCSRCRIWPALPMMTVAPARHGGSRWASRSAAS